MTTRTQPSTAVSTPSVGLRRAVVAGPGGLEIKETPVPALEPGTVRLRTRASLISTGTETALVRAALEGRQQDETVTGYVAAGEVLATGPGVERFRAGERVAGIKWMMASHATESVVPQHCLARIPDGVSYEDAVFAGLAATGLHAVRQSDVQPGHAVAVVGAGLIGQFCAQFARLAGGRVLITDTLALRREAALACGAEAALDPRDGGFGAAVRAFTCGRGLERGLLAFGGDLTEAFAQLLATMTLAPDGKRCGRITLAGLGDCRLPNANALGNVTVAATAACGAGYRDPAWERGAAYTPGYVPWTLDRNLEEILRWTARGDFRAAPLRTHTLPFSEARAAWTLLLERPQEALGVVLTYD